ncbi:hypothetical protein HPB52_017359 [Rhipicephalus sanguineus]|uniref:Uncharacterized protein n=1 Tax=Rhipicephalus sanguineus TaxID=34632 RepID=A0A9D4Q6S8_RHISA|nr:hypothetical protein HPB52_017359 [Rhipicephalus sanguineus]
MHALPTVADGTVCGESDAAQASRGTGFRYPGGAWIYPGALDARLASRGEGRVSRPPTAAAQLFCVECSGRERLRTKGRTARSQNAERGRISERGPVPDSSRCVWSALRAVVSAPMTPCGQLRAASPLV